MSTLRLILGDQLSAAIATLSDIDKQSDRVLGVEVSEEATYVRHHQQKLVLVLSAMRHFAAALKKAGVKLDYVRMDSKANTGSFNGEVKRALQRCHYEQLVVTEPGEWRAPLAAVEGFVRQVVGWREYIRGFYWLQMPGYERSNFALLTSLAPAEVEAWYFLISKEKQLRSNPRMGLAYRNLFNKPEAEIDAIVQQSEQFLGNLNAGGMRL